MARRWIYGLDTETDHDDSSAWIVQWSLTDGTDYATGTDDESLLQTLTNLIHSDHKSYIYIHNLDYDIAFMRRILHDIAFEQGCDTSIISRYGKIIQFTLEPGEDAECGGTLIFRDTMKKIPGSSVKTLGELIGCPKLEGVSEDFHAGWSKEVDLSDPARWDYVKRDSLIVQKVAQMLHDAGDTKATASGDSWKAVKKFFQERPNGKRDIRNLRFARLFPNLGELDARFRCGYCGGLNISPYINRGKVANGPITHLDCTSLYPTVMYNDPLPTGYPTLTYEQPYGKTYIIECRAKLTIKPEYEDFAWMPFKHSLDYSIENMEPGMPIVETREYHEFTWTNVDLDTIADWYDIDFDPDYPTLYWSFISKEGLFDGYIEDLIAKKSTSTGLARMRYKLKMNSVYGRFGLSHESEETVLEWDEEFGDYAFHSVETVNDDAESYLPVAMFVTSYGRARLLDAVKAAIEVSDGGLLHCDTDSVIFKGDLQPDHPAWAENCVRLGDDLGQWKTEGVYDHGYEGGYKKYMFFHVPEPREVSDVSCALAGVPQHTKTVNGVTIPTGMWVECLDMPEKVCENASLGHEHYCIRSQWIRELYEKAGVDWHDVNTMKLIPRKVPGGVILDEREHTFKDNLIWRIRRF